MTFDRINDGRRAEVALCACFVVHFCVYQSVNQSINQFINRNEAFIRCILFGFVLLEFFDDMDCARPIIDRNMDKCFNSSFLTPLNGTRVNLICKYYNVMYRCLYGLVEPECGQVAAVRHVEYRIKLWAPPVVAFYCTLGIYLPALRYDTNYDMNLHLN